MIISILSANDYEEFIPLMNEFRNFAITKEKFTEILEQMEKTGNTFNYVAREKEKGPIIGTAKLIIECKFYHNGMNVGHIEDLVIKKEYSGKGYGSLFLRLLGDIALILGCYKVTLSCNNEIIPFYEKNEFKINGTTMAKYLE